MKKLLLIIAVIFSLKLSAGDVIRTWECDELTVKFYSNDTMLVGGLLYDVSYQGEHMVLHAGGRGMLLAKKGMNGSITIYNTDNIKDKKFFTKCIN